MVHVSRSRVSWFVFLLSLIVCSNTLIYHTDILKPFPKDVVLGSMIDFIIVIPILTYFFIMRGRFSLKYILVVAILGYGAATFIIPMELRQSYSFIKYILFACEGAFILLEVYLVFTLARKLPLVLKSFRKNRMGAPLFQYRMEAAVTQHFKKSRMLDILITDLTMYYYSFCSWRRRPVEQLEDISLFTFHKNSSAIAFNIMLIHAIVLESVGFHFLIHSWNATLSIVLLVLNILTVFFIIAEIQVIRFCPYVITDQHLYMQVGIMKRLRVPLVEIKQIQHYQGPDKLSKEEQREVFDAVLTDFMKEKPIYEIEFTRPQEMKLMYGFKRKVTKAHLRPDEPQKFYEILSGKITKENQMDV
jgi:membrane protein YdbS with pleckstrin-like domain